MMQNKSATGLVSGILLLAAIPPLSAQEGRFEGPNSGYLFHFPSRSLRAVMGVPGAARLSHPLIRGLSFASVAPDGSRALIQTDSGWLLADQLSGAEPRLRVVEGAQAGADRIGWNRIGSVAVLSSTAKGIQRIRIAPNSLTVEALPSIWPLVGNISAIAVDSSGEHVVVGMEHAEAGGLYLIEHDRSPRLLVSMPSPVDAVFEGSSRRLLAADRSTRSLVELTDVMAPAAVFFDGGSTGIRDPIALAVFGDSLFVANASPQSLQVFSLAEGRVRREIMLEFEPAALLPFSEKPLYLLRSPAGPGEPAWMLDARQETAVWFVPAAEEREEQ